MWDCTPLITDAALKAIAAKGGVKAIAILAPSTSMPPWSTGAANWAACRSICTKTTATG